MLLSLTCIVIDVAAVVVLFCLFVFLLLLLLLLFVCLFVCSFVFVFNNLQKGAGDLGAGVSKNQRDITVSFGLALLVR